MTPEEIQKELLKKFENFSKSLDESNEITVQREKERLQRNKDKRKEKLKTQKLT